MDGRGTATGLGDVRDHRLVVNRPEAETVKHIYERYLETRFRQAPEKRFKAPRDCLQSSGVEKRRCAIWRPAILARSSLTELPSNPISSARSATRRNAIQGSTQPIVSREPWEKVQLRLRDQAATHREGLTKAPPSPLAGKLFDENGEPLYVQGAVKGTRHYRYYVSRGLVRGSVQDERCRWRVSAPEPTSRSRRDSADSP